MSFATEKNILSLLYAFNPWWNSKTISKEVDKPIKRIVFYEALKAFIHKEIRRNVVLSGARRTGKTTIMYQTISYLMENGVSPLNILFVSFDHPLLKECNIDDILAIYFANISTEDKTYYCFFDEVQNSLDWDSYMKMTYDLYPNIKIMASGSASPILENKTRESGLGRWRILHVPTLSFYEYCELLHLDKPILDKDIKPMKLYLLSPQEQLSLMHKLSFLQSHFVRYLQVGGFPELALSSDNIYSQRMIREQIINMALKRDLPAIYSIRDISEVEKVFMYFCYTSSNIVNVSSICQELKINRVTLDKYIRYLESANLIYISNQINISPKQALKSQSKIYISDAALRNALLMKDDITNDPTELGIVAEIAVYKHVKVFSYQGLANVGYFRGTPKDKEIDIVVQYHQGESPIMIEVKYRCDSKIKENDAIVTYSSLDKPNLVVTKSIDDYGLFHYGENKAIYKIPAPVFLYLLGYIESNNVKDSLLLNKII